MLEQLSAEDLHLPEPEGERSLKGVHERLLPVVEQVDGYRRSLENILSVNLTLVSIQQNTQAQKFSSRYRPLSRVFTA